MTQTKIDTITVDMPITIKGQAPAPSVSIRADAAGPLLDLHELWVYREVLVALVRRETKIRYAQTVVGIGWAVLQPVLTTIVLTMLAGRWMRAPVGGVSYSVFTFAGLIPWIYFTHVVTRSSVCLLNDNGLLSKAYFPRLLLPLAASIGGLVDLFVMLVILLALMGCKGTNLGAGILLSPLCLIFLVIVATGAGTWIAVLNLYHRDIAHALPFIMQLGFFVTPVAYPESLVPSAWRFAYALNPMAGVIESFRWCLFPGSHHNSLLQLGPAAGAGLALLFSALFYFSRKAKTLADVGGA